jgi:hypothetical protein
LAIHPYGGKDRGLLVALDPDDGLAIARQQFGLSRHEGARLQFESCSPMSNEADRDKKWTKPDICKGNDGNDATDYRRMERGVLYG